MTKRTKRALVSSALALLLCFTMLLGTTYAWFTDSVETVKNKIVAGNLDIELYSAFQPEDGVLDWTMVDANTNIFMENTLWEPGHLEVAYLKVANAGTLALEWDLAINIFDEVTSKSVLGNELKLSKYLKANLIELDDETAYADRDIAKTVLDGVGYGLTNYANGGKLEATQEKYYALVVYMPEEVGNEANYAKGEKVPTIDMGITLLATQTPFEKDSFGPDYDEDATYNTVKVATTNELAAAVAEGGTIMLTDSMEVTKPIEVTKDTTIYLNGNTLTAYAADARAFKVTGKDVTLTIEAMDTTTPFGNGTYGIVEVADTAENANIVINGGTYKGKTDEGGFVKVRTGAKDVTITLNNVTYTDTCPISDDNTNAWVTNFTANEGDNVKLVVNGGTYNAACGFHLNNADATFTGVTMNLTAFGLMLMGEGDYLVEDCIINMNPGAYTYDTPGAAVSAAYGSTVNVKGGKITVTSADCSALSALPSGGKVIAEGVEIDADVDAVVFDPYAGAPATAVIIDGVAQ